MNKKAECNTLLTANLVYNGQYKAQALCYLNIQGGNL